MLGNVPMNVSGAQYSPDGHEIAITGDGVSIHDTTDGKLKRSWNLPISGGAVGTSWSPDGRWLAVASRQPNLVHIYDAATGREKTLLRGLPERNALVICFASMMVRDSGYPLGFRFKSS